MVSEQIRIGDEYYLLASALNTRRPRLVLNHGDSFAIFDLAGDIPLVGLDPFGLIHRGTRFLNRFELRINGDLPILLSSVASEDGCELITYLTNKDKQHDGEIVLTRDTVAIERRKTLLEHRLYETLRLQNFGPTTLDVLLSFRFGADFADEFELRGTARSRPGERAPVQVGQHSVRLGYRGADGVERRTLIRFSPEGWRVDAERAELVLTLPRGEEAVAEVDVACEAGEPREMPSTFRPAVAMLRNERRNWCEAFPRITSSDEGFNAWLGRSLHDLALLRVEDPRGSHVHAGIPWFATLFGRDSILTALEVLAFSPELAAGTLRRLAAYQGTERDAFRNEEPGRILHEIRHGELAAVGDVPFGRYYGSVDSTPLFLMLLVDYADRTGDLALPRQLWPAALAAMRWIDTDGDADGDGYVEYERRTPRGLVNQGWKDSHDAVSHADGRLAEPPIALAEVQAYVYAARRGMARLARRLDAGGEPELWEARAEQLRRQFNRDFWLEDEDTFALALDRDKAPCRVVASNAGHCLFGGIAEPEHGRRTIERLMRDDVFCGWGLRTLSSSVPRYNPMSYHNGSVWPHDNAIVAAGFARYGGRSVAARLLTALFQAALGIETRRLPELFCGFARQLNDKPVPYPVACSPQAWAAGSVFLFLQAVLGLSIDAWERRMTFDQARLPEWLENVEIRGLRLGESKVDLFITRGHAGAAVEVMDKQGDLQIVVTG